MASFKQQTQYWKTRDPFSEDEVNKTFFEELENEMDNSQKILLLQDIAKRYFSKIEAEVTFLLLKNRRNKDISMILGIQEPEVARFKKLVIRKAAIYYRFKYQNDVEKYKEPLTQILELNEKQADILSNFLNFRSLSYIGNTVGSKSSNMHRSLNAIKNRLLKVIDEHPEFNIILEFFEASKYINNQNKDFTIIDDII